MSTLLGELKQSWRRVADSEPGYRFVQYHQRVQSERTLAKTALRLGGVLFILFGVLLWFLPGPGWLFVLLGLAMFAGESRGVARSLDWAEVTVRSQARSLRSWWRTAVPAVRVMSVVGVLGVLAAVGSAAAWALFA